MSSPVSRFVEGTPRLHYLEWQPRGSRTLVLLHGNSANAWWWQSLAESIAPKFRLLALDQRGHGDSQAVDPPQYRPEDYADDVSRFVKHCGLEPAIVVGHSMGGMVSLAFAKLHPEAVRALIVVDAALTSSPRRDQFLRRLTGLPVVIYPDLETAKARFRLMPREGDVPAHVVAAIAEHSLARLPDARYTLKFDRETFFGGDGLDALGAISAVHAPILLVRGERSRIMTADAMHRAVESNPMARMVTIPQAHHHILLERPELLARAIEDFVDGQVTP
ncbi:MAG TPA: alpha/beta hydrolase [Candidatus Binataceae bacterium]|nr:alpha/beta hydrolase [Candidatus Binataceae bacterium]